MAWKYKWTNIEYSEGNFDINDIKLYMRKDEVTMQELLVFDFPALKEWKISAHQESNQWIIPEESDIQLVFKDFSIDFQTYFHLKDTGFLSPQVTAIEFHFGESYFYHDNFIVAFVMHQVIEYLIVIIENTVYFVGPEIFSNMFEPIMTSFLDDYKLTVPVEHLVWGQTGSDSYQLDYRNVYPPYLYSGAMEFQIYGDTIFNGQGCGITEFEPISFLPTQEYSQFVVSQTAAACLVNQLAKS